MNFGYWNSISVEYVNSNSNTLDKKTTKKILESNIYDSILPPSLIIHFFLKFKRFPEVSVRLSMTCFGQNTTVFTSACFRKGSDPPTPLHSTPLIHPLVVLNNP